MNDSAQNDVCKVCGAPLSAVETTPTGKKLQRCSKGSWNRETRQTEGCAYVKWIQDPPETLDEKCPKCGAALVLQTTRYGKKMKKCSAGGWDREAKKPTGCDYVNWMDEKEMLDEECPKCGEKLVMTKTTKGKKLKKCSTSGWDSKNKIATGCDYVEWINANKEKFTPAGAPNGDEQMPDFEV